MKAQFELCFKCPHMETKNDKVEELTSYTCKLREEENNKPPYPMFQRGCNAVVASYDAVEKTLFRWPVEVPEACPYKLEYVLQNNESIP